VSDVTDMRHMFWCCSSFNQPLDSWNVSNVRNVEHMFAYTISYNQPLLPWDLTNATGTENMFFGSLYRLVNEDVEEEDDEVGIGAPIHRAFLFLYNSIVDCCNSFC
jgi:surface protein